MSVTLRTPWRRLATCSPLLGVWLWPSAAMAQTAPPTEMPSGVAADSDETKLACAKSYEMSQRLRQDGKLLLSREQALACAQPSCPGLLVGDCTRWLSELDGALPSVIIEVRDARGQAVADALVTVDGEPLASSLDGRALSLDPGQRRFRVQVGSGQVLERTLVITEGQKGQALRFELPPAPPAAPPPAPARRTPALFYGAAAFSVMGSVGFAYFGLQGRADQEKLQDSCAPRCSDAELAPLRRTYLAADVSLGIGVAALGVLGYLWLSGDHESSGAVGAGATAQAASLSYRRRF